MSSSNKARRIPTSRLSRLSKVGSLAARVTGSVLAQGTTQLLSGQRPNLKDLVLTPGNIERITNQLATMRGAAMKMGQLLSIDDGEFLSPELSAILARLRQDADPMPKSQVQQVLDDAWGEGWQEKLLYFSFAPIAAASIGQVHKGITFNGVTMAIKVQYPGIRKSIDSDVDNVMSLIRLIGVLPEEIDAKPLLTEAKRQLHAEADYEHEAAMLTRYADMLAEDDDYLCPDVISDWTTQTVLAMTYVNGQPISALESAPQEVRDAMMTSLFRLFFMEAFKFRLVQTDPNLANYLVDLDNQQWVLLDFGATREFPERLSIAYLDLVNAAAKNDQQGMLDAAKAIGLLDDTANDQQAEIIVAMLAIACEPLHTEGAHDFAQNDAAQRLQELGWALSFEANFWQLPPADAAFLHRKLGGLYLLARRLGAKVNLRAIIQEYLTN